MLASRQNLQLLGLIIFISSIMLAIVLPALGVQELRMLDRNATRKAQQIARDEAAELGEVEALMADYSQPVWRTIPVLWPVGVSGLIGLTLFLSFPAPTASQVRRRRKSRRR